MIFFLYLFKDPTDFLLDVMKMCQCLCVWTDPIFSSFSSSFCCPCLRFVHNGQQGLFITKRRTESEFTSCSRKEANIHVMSLVLSFLREFQLQTNFSFCLFEDVIFKLFKVDSFYSHS